MSARRGAWLVFSLVVVACSGGGDTAGPPGPTATPPVPDVSVPDTSAAPSPTRPEPTTTSAVTEPVPATAPPGIEPGVSSDEFALLVPAPEGLALWRSDRVDWLIVDRPVAAAVPDLAGGVLFQYVDPADPAWVWDEAVGRWVATWPGGEPEPILRQRMPGGAVEVAVPADGSRLWLLDVGMVAGAPAVAFGRLVGGDQPVAVGFDYCAEVGRCGDFSWRVELVVRPIEGGAERVVHEALWQPGITESTAYTARLGRDLVALSVDPYEGDAERWGAVELIDPDGVPVDVGYRTSPWCTGCDLAADLAPTAQALAYVERHHDPTDANLTTRAEVVLVDAADWIERWRVDVSGGSTIETDGDRVVVATESTCADEIGPDLGPGAEGTWVERLQRQLNRLIGAGIAVDGRYGPATEDAVEAWQELRRMPPTGAVESATWVGLLPDRSCSSELLVVEGGQASSISLDVGWGVGGPETWSGAPDRGPSIWVGPDARIAEPADLSGILGVDGIGSIDIGTPEPEAVPALVALLGDPDVDRPLAPIGADEDGCVEGSSWLDCVRANDLLRGGRLLEWNQLGLTVVLTDGERSGTDMIEVPLRVEGWLAVPATGTAVPTTPEGLRPGSSIGDVRDAVSDLVWHFNEGVWDSFSFSPSTARVADCAGCGSVHATLAWAHDENQYVAAVQESLNAHGADLAVDGVVGPRTQAAWTEFCVDHELVCDTESPWWVWMITEDQRDALDFPPPSVRIASLSASTSNG